jgi:hypothetical protein
MAGRVLTIDSAPLAWPGKHVRDFLFQLGRVEPLAGYEPKYLSIHTPVVLARLQNGDLDDRPPGSSWRLP